MYDVMDATFGWSMLYFIILIVLGAFFLINLFLKQKILLVIISVMTTE